MNRFAIALFISFFISHLGVSQVGITIEAQKSDDSTVTSKPDKPIKMALLMPFFKNGGDTTNRQKAFAASSLDYLAGVRAALDSLEKTGKITFDLYIEDTELDSSIVEYILNKPDYKDLDIVIGPVFASGVDMALSVLAGRNTALYLPFEKELKNTGMKYVFLNQKKESATAAYLADMLVKQAGEKDIVLAYSGKEGKKTDSLIYQQLIEKIDTGRLRTVDLASKANPLGIASLSSKKEYVLLIYSHDNYYVNSALKQAKGLNQPVIYGMSEWLEFEDPEYLLWEDLHVKFLARFFIDYEDENTGNFRKLMIQTYNQDPVEYTYRGFNDLMYLAFATDTYNILWPEQCPGHESPNCVGGYYWVKDPGTGAYYNGYHSVFNYHNLKLTREK